MKQLTLSIIIPVFNEEDYLLACLESIAQQTEKPLEVLVVDNNSTDNTVHIAKQFRFVTVLHEKLQGQGFAQVRGFKNSKADILARIDADSVLPRDWVKNLRARFTQNLSIVAVTGGGEPYDSPLRVFTRHGLEVYHYKLGRLLFGQNMLWGANCAVRKAAWRKVASQVHTQHGFWEDYDLSFRLKPIGDIYYDPKISVGFSTRNAHDTLPKQAAYQLNGFRTIRLHKPLWLACVYLLSRVSMVVYYPIARLDFYLYRRSLKHR